jgi:hypothetical protein
MPVRCLREARLSQHTLADFLQGLAGVVAGFVIKEPGKFSLLNRQLDGGRGWGHSRILSFPANLLPCGPVRRKRFARE